MANDINKKRSRHIYRLFTAFHWTLFVGIAGTDGAAIFFAEGTSTYWGGGLAAAIVVLFIAIQDLIILKQVMTYDKKELSKKKFIDSFNWQGLNILLSFPACIAGIAVSATMGANYGQREEGDNSTSTKTDTDKIDEDLVNIEENRILGTILAIICGMAVLIMVRTICLHGEVRTALCLPEKNTASAQTNPARAPASAQTPAASGPSPSSASNETSEIQLLKAQNNLLKEQNRLQKEQLEHMTMMHGNYRGISLISGGVTAPPPPPPPDYSTLVPVSPPPGYVSHGQNQAKF